MLLPSMDKVKCPRRRKHTFPFQTTVAPWHVCHKLRLVNLIYSSQSLPSISSGKREFPGFLSHLSFFISSTCRFPVTSFCLVSPQFPSGLSPHSADPSLQRQRVLWRLSTQHIPHPHRGRIFHQVRVSKRWVMLSQTSQTGEEKERLQKKDEISKSQYLWLGDKW